MTQKQIIKKFLDLHGTGRMTRLYNAMSSFVKFVKSKGADFDPTLMDNMYNEAEYYYTDNVKPIQFSDRMLREMKSAIAESPAKATEKKPTGPAKRKSPGRPKKTATTTPSPSSEERKIERVEIPATYECDPLFKHDEYLTSVCGKLERGGVIMIHGRAGAGKSRFTLDICKYFNKTRKEIVCYISKEQIPFNRQEKKFKATGSLITAVFDKKARHSNLHFYPGIPADEVLEKYDLIILDSVSKLKLTEQDLDELKEKFPDKTTVLIYHSTKDGNGHLGGTGHRHDPDIELEAILEKDKITGIEKGYIVNRKTRVGKKDKIEIRYVN